MGKIKQLLRLLKKAVLRLETELDVFVYQASGRKPWSRGYNFSKFRFIRFTLQNKELMDKFLLKKNLPEGFGYGYDERVVEYPWAISRMIPGEARVLDAGSVFNFREIVEHPLISSKKLTILTLAPEGNAFWQKGISYHYGDLRNLPFKDAYFDQIFSISTLGHVGMDTSMYTGKNVQVPVKLQAGQAVQELLRVLRPGGKLLISVVFGRNQLIEWNNTVFAQQFDSGLLKLLLKEFSACSSTETIFYKYTRNGWNISNEENCQNEIYFNIHTDKSIPEDNAAAARSVALIQAIK